MDAWSTDPATPARLEVREVPDAVPGWDAAGHVVRAAADGSGPELGAGVLFLGLSGGWARLRAVPTSFVAQAPEAARAEQLATVPVPVTSALRAVRRLGSLLGRRLLVVGANSTIGSAAVQIG